MFFDGRIDDQLNAREVGMACQVVRWRFGFFGFFHTLMPYGARVAMSPAFSLSGPKQEQSA